MPSIPRRARPWSRSWDNTDAVPGHATGQFFDFQFVAPNPSRMAISLNDNGQVVYWAQFCLEATCTSTNMKNCLFGSTAAGCAHDTPDGARVGRAPSRSVRADDRHGACAATVAVR